LFTKVVATTGRRSYLLLRVGSADIASTMIDPALEPPLVELIMKGGTVRGFFGPQGRYTTFYTLD
jgi:hypothetical protein